MAYHEQEKAGESQYDVQTDIETRIDARNGEGEDQNEIRCERLVSSTYEGRYGTYRWGTIAS